MSSFKSNNDRVNPMGPNPVILLAKAQLAGTTSDTIQRGPFIYKNISKLNPKVASSKELLDKEKLKLDLLGPLTPNNNPTNPGKRDERQSLGSQITTNQPQSKLLDTPQPKAMPKSNLSIFSAYLPSLTPQHTRKGDLERKNSNNYGLIADQVAPMPNTTKARIVPTLRPSQDQRGNERAAVPQVQSSTDLNVREAEKSNNENNELRKKRRRVVHKENRENNNAENNDQEKNDQALATEGSVTEREREPEKKNEFKIRRVAPKKHTRIRMAAILNNHRITLESSDLV